MTCFEKLRFESSKKEASSLDQINMTKNQLEYDRKNFTPMNLNVRT